VAPSGGLGSCASGLCTPHGFQNAGIIDVTGRVTRSDGTPSALDLNPNPVGGSGPNGVQVFTRGSAALRPSGCSTPSYSRSPSSTSFTPSGAASTALPEGSDDYLHIDIKRDGDVEIVHASGQAAEDIAFAMDLSNMSDEDIADSIQKAQLQLQRAVNGVTDIGPEDDVARLLITLEREKHRRAATLAHSMQTLPESNQYVTFIETAGAARAATLSAGDSADAAWGYGASGQAAGGTGGSTTTGNSAEIQRTGQEDKTATGTTESRPDPAVVAAIGQGTTALITLLNSRLAAGDAAAREQRAQEFQLELERIRRESGGAITTDQNAAITAALAALAAQQQQLANERAAAAAAEQEKQKKSMMMMLVIVAIVVALGGVAWYMTRNKGAGGARSNPSRHGGMNPYEAYVRRANRAAASAAR